MPIRTANVIVPESKSQLRARMKAVRRSLSSQARREKSAAIGQRFAALADRAGWNNVFAYVSYLNEVRTHELIQQLLAAGARVAVPKVDKSPVMHAIMIREWSDLAPGQYGILEPREMLASEGVSELALDVCVVPGLAFSPRGARLGYGQGHYDHFLARHPNLIAVALAFECQVVDNVPTEPTDRDMTMIVTEDRVIESGRG